MEIRFKTSKLRKSCTDEKVLMKTHGPERGKILKRRLDQLRAAENLAMVKTLPGRCHALSSDRKGTLAIDLDGPYRLLFEPAENPAPQLDDGGLDWDAVETIRILEVENYHD
ncbi:MAG: killer suppression protein [Acidobacteria bacterium]|nr:MAG: killer suppression protein [Acidobacteriota bacterium]